MAKLNTGTTCCTARIGARIGGRSNPPPNPVMPLHVPATKAATPMTARSSIATSPRPNSMHQSSSLADPELGALRPRAPTIDIPGPDDRDGHEQGGEGQHAGRDGIADKGRVV